MLSDSSTIRDKNCVRLPLLSGPLSILIWMRLVSAFSRWIMVRRAVADGRDRKSTRLNSSHEWTSYAVFCLKKKIGELDSAVHDDRKPEVPQRLRKPRQQTGGGGADGPYVQCERVDEGDGARAARRFDT